MLLYILDWWLELKLHWVLRGYYEKLLYLQNKMIKSVSLSRHQIFMHMITYSTCSICVVIKWGCWTTTLIKGPIYQLKSSSKLSWGFHQLIRSASLHACCMCIKYNDARIWFCLFVAHWLPVTTHVMRYSSYFDIMVRYPMAKPSSHE